jgi:release factor glutamine methyltransferase
MLLLLKQKFFIFLIKIIQKFGPHRVEVLGNVYEISAEVFNPKYYYTSMFMAGHIHVDSDDTVLDMGTGSGIQAVTAARQGSRVTAVDINPEAVTFARKNAALNGLKDRITVTESDLFQYLDPEQKFNVILFTPPYLEGTPKEFFDHALQDPQKKLLKRFFLEAGNYLEKNGYVQMLYSSIAGPDAALKISHELGWNHNLMAREKTFSEEFLIFRLTPG